jgi:hypothetical protein
MAGVEMARQAVFANKKDGPSGRLSMALMSCGSIDAKDGPMGCLYGLSRVIAGPAEAIIGVLLR